eukprot:gene42482-52872_t
MLADLKNQVSKWAEKLPHITAEEKDKLLEAVAKAEAWISEKEEAQAAKSPFEDPVFESGDVPLQLKPVGLIFDRLLKKPKPAPPAPEKNATVTVNETAANSTSADNSTSSEGESVKVEVDLKTDESSSSADSSTSAADDEAGKAE